MSLAQMNFDSDSDDDPDFTPDVGAYSDDGLLRRIEAAFLLSHNCRILTTPVDPSSQASEPSAKRTKLEEESLALEAAVTEEESVTSLLCEGSA